MNVNNTLGILNKKMARGVTLSAALDFCEKQVFTFDGSRADKVNVPVGCFDCGSFGPAKTGIADLLLNQSEILPSGGAVLSSYDCSYDCSYDSHERRSEEIPVGVRLGKQISDCAIDCDCHCDCTIIIKI